MSERVFEYVEGGSKKFWAVSVSGAAHTVRYGRIGTAGQSKTKTFPTEAAARRDADKLIAEKTAKGYKEVTQASGGRKPPGDTPSTPPASTPGGLRPPLAEPTAPPTVTRSIDLDPTDHLWVTYRPRPAVQTPTPEPFDLARCLQEFEKVYEKWNRWQFDKVRVPKVMSPEEGQFWAAAVAELARDRGHSVVRVHLARMAYDGTAVLPQVRALIAGRLHNYGAGSWKIEYTVGRVLNAALSAVLTPELFLELLAEELPQPPYTTTWQGENLADQFRTAVLPRMTDTQLDKARELLRPQVSVTKWPVDSYAPAPYAFHLAALCGLHREMEALVQTWPDGLGTHTDTGDYFYKHPQRTVFGLDSVEKVIFHMRRLRLRLTRPEYVRAWLAHTGWSALDVVRDSVLTATRKDDAEVLTRELCRVNAPEAAPYLLELRLDSKAPGPARDWLAANVANAVAGLLTVAAGNGKLARAAVEYLRDVKRKEGTGVFGEVLKTATPELAAFVRWAVLEHQEKVYPLLDVAAAPAELRDALDQLPAVKKSALPAWTDLATLPPVLVGGARLPDPQVAGLLAALKAAPGGPVPPVVAALRKHADPHALDAFAWHVFELWVREGMPTRDRWAFAAVALLGGDASALKLTPLIREWPGMSKHRQAVTGLEALRAIGTDTALMQLNGIAQKVKFPGVKNKAREMMEAIAADRGLTRAELEDRIVPDLGLDGNGGRTFDFGPRQFRVVLAPDLAPVIRDADGKVRADLPKPGAKDDPEKAAAAVAEWKLLKKQLREALKLQGPRLEQAMVTQRRWLVADFETLLVRHPLMTNLARRLVWGGYDEAGRLARTFRVTDEKDYAGPDDRPVSLAGVRSIGLVHPLHLDEPTRAAWGQVMGEYELIPPFPQLGRPVFRPDPGEARQKEITRFNGARVPSMVVWGATEKLGWVRGSSTDHGVVMEFVKLFPAAGVSAVMGIEPGIPRGAIDALAAEQTITRCFFLDRPYTPASYPYHRDEQKRPLGEVDPVAVSEALADLTALAAKGK